MKELITPSRLDAIQSYIKVKLLPMLGERLEPLDFIVPNYGGFTTVIICRGDKRGLVIRIYGRLNNFFNAKKAGEYFSEHDIPCPRILYSRICPDVSLGVAKFLLVEEEIRGSHLHEVEEYRDEIIAQTGKMLALRHSHKRTSCEPVSLPPFPFSRWKYRSPLDLVFGRAERFLGKLVLREGLTTIEARAAADFYENARPEIMRRPHYELIHRDLTPANIVVREKMPFMIDLENACFSHFAYDLVWAEKNLCRTACERQLLLTAYFAESGHTSAEEYEEGRRFFETHYHLGKAYKFLRKIRKENEEDTQSPLWKQYRLHKDQLISLIS